MAASRRLLKGVAVLATLGALTLTVAALLYWQEERQLNRSLSVLGERLWGVQLSKQRGVTSSSLFESEGVWLVQWEGAPGMSQTQFLVDGMSIADESDHDYYRRKVTSDLALSFPLDSYVLFRGEFPLGDGTICTVLACNIEVFLKEREPTMIIRISTT